MNHSIPSGVITGDKVQEVFKLAKEKAFALPAVNVTGNNTINAVKAAMNALNQLKNH